jgi:FtsH-binding integral membrane protein
MVLGGFVLIGWLARAFAANVTSKPAQYAGLGLYVVGEAVIFAPLILLALVVSDSGDILIQAALLTAALFTGLTAVVFITGKDFSFLRTFLVVGGMIAVGLIVTGTIFGFDLGLAFSAGMIVLACGAILYDTSKIIHNFDTDQHVAAALELFASVALLLWYIIRILLRARR